MGQATWFYRETITGVVLRHDWASGHSSCHIYCWGVWINDQMDSAGCTTLTFNCQLHCEYPTILPLYSFFHSGSEFRRINTASLFLIHFKKSLSRNIGTSCFSSGDFGDGSSRIWRDIACLSFLMIEILRDPVAFLTTMSHYSVLVEYCLCHLNGYLYSSIFGMALI